MTRDWVQGSGQTVGAASVIAASYTVPSDTTVLLQFILVGKSTTGKTATYSASQAAQNIGGTLTMIGSLLAVVPSFLQGSDATLTSCSASVSTSGTTVQLSVTGVISVTVNWEGEIYAYVKA